MTLFEIILSSLCVVMLVLLAILFRRHDLLAERTTDQESYIKALLMKALRDKRDMVREPAERMEQVFQTGVRTLPNTKQFNQKPGQHPALRS